MLTIEYYILSNGKCPFEKWLKSIDSEDRNRIYQRINRVSETGNFGDYKNLGDGVFELRFSFGPGYRIYFGRKGRAIIMILAGGNKSSQVTDIIVAKNYWKNFN